MNKIIKHEQMLEVIAGNDRYYIQEKYKNDFLVKLNTSKFVEIGGEIVACREIQKVKPVDSEVASIIRSLPAEQRQKIKEKMDSYKYNLGKDAKKETILHWIEKNQAERNHNSNLYTISTCENKYLKHS